MILNLFINPLEFLLPYLLDELRFEGIYLRLEMFREGYEVGIDMCSQHCGRERFGRIEVRDRWIGRDRLSRWVEGGGVGVRFVRHRRRSSHVASSASSKVWVLFNITCPDVLEIMYQPLNTIGGLDGLDN